MTRLSQTEHAFFAKLSAIVFSNPFSSIGLEAEPWLHVPPPTGTTHVFTQLAPIVDERLKGLERAGISELHDVPEEQREALQHAYLFQAFQRFVGAFDQLIDQQMRQPEVDAPVTFADDLLAQLELRGMQKEVCTHYLALFYQLRRAYYFIAQALVGRAHCMQRLRESLWNNVFTHDARRYERVMWSRMEDFSTLLLGPTGSGKGSAAAAIGQSGFIPFNLRSRRFTVNFTQTFTAANLSQFPENLIESTLFGHRKGSFTGAVADHRGLLERCSEHGALFLDEIGDVTATVQLKLLEVLQQRTFTRVGEHQHRQFRGRVIAATNQSVQVLRENGRFRDDFFYRLSSDVIEVPSLRQRIEEHPEELVLLIESLARRLLGEDSGSFVEAVFDALARDLPENYAWPGNVRELEQALRRIILSNHYTGDPCAVAPTRPGIGLHGFEHGELTAQQLLSQYCLMLYRRHGTYEEVAKRTQLDRRTVKKHVTYADSA